MCTYICVDIYFREAQRRTDERGEEMQRTLVMNEGSALVTQHKVTSDRRCKPGLYFSHMWTYPYIPEDDGRIGPIMARSVEEVDLDCHWLTKTFTETKTDVCFFNYMLRHF